MTWSRKERLYHRLPEIYRRRDREQGEPLRAFLSIVESQLEAVEDDVARLYDNWFIETCEDWVVPYLGDLLGVRVLGEPPHAGAHPRAQVAQVLDDRQRKGTSGVLERLARDVVGWPARVVEMFERLAWTQDMSHVRPGQGGTFDVRRGAAALARDESPFAPPSVFRSVDVRRIGSRRGRFNLPNLGLYLWRLEALPIEGSPAAAAEGTGGAGFRFDPLGSDIPLFNRLARPVGTVRQAAETDLPVPITLAALDRDLRQPVSGFYGPGKAIRVVGEKEMLQCKVVARNLDSWGAVGLRSGPLDLPVTAEAPEVAVTLGGHGPHVARLGRRPVDAADAAILLEAALRTARPGDRFALARVVLLEDRLLVVSGLPGDQVAFGGTDRDARTAGKLGLSAGTPARGVVAAGVPPFPDIPEGGVAIDPERGRLLFSAPPASPVRVDYAYGFAAEMGGGPYDRRATLTEDAAVAWMIEVGGNGAAGAVPDLPAALARWTADGTPDAVIRFIDNDLYEEDFQITVPRGVRLALEAADGRRPVLRPAGRPRIAGAAGAGAPGTLVINGLLLDGGLDLALATGEALRLEIAHSTLVPRSGRASLGFLAGGDPFELSVRVTSSIVGALQLPADVAALEVEDSILDAAAGGGGASPLPALVSGPLPVDAERRIAFADSPTLTVTIGSSGPMEVRLRKAPADLEEARVVLQEALRAASPLPSFRNASMLRLGGQYLLARSGIAGEPLSFDGGVAAALQLADPPERRMLNGLLSGSLSPFPAPEKLQVSVAIGGDGPHIVNLATWNTAEEAAQRLRDAIRGAASTAAFRQATVEVLQVRVEQPSGEVVIEDRLLVRPGIAGALLSMAGLPASPSTIAALGLQPPISPPDGTFVQGVFSGQLSSPLELRSARLQATLGGTTRELSLAGKTGTVDEVAAALRESLKSFTGAEVKALGNRLLVLYKIEPSAPAPAIAGTSDDPETVRELALAAPAAENVYGLLSGGPVSVPAWTKPRLQVAVGGAAPRTLTLDRVPRDAGGMREVLQAALAAAGVADADILILADAGMERLLIRAGGAAVSFSEIEDVDEKTAGELRLVVPPPPDPPAVPPPDEARALQGLLSGSIGVFPKFPLPALAVTFGLGTDSYEIELAGFPRDLATLRTLLENALRQAADVPKTAARSFEQARVFLLEMPQNSEKRGRLLVVSGEPRGEKVTFKRVPSDPNTVLDTALATPPAQAASPLLSGALAPFPPELQGKVQVTLASLGPRALPLGGLPGTLDRAVEMLERGLRSFTEPAFQDGRVFRLGNRLLVLSGVLGSKVEIKNWQGSTLADDLRLTTEQGARSIQGRLSGDLATYPVDLPRARLQVRFGTTTTPFQAVELLDLPVTVAEAAAELQESLRAVTAGGAAFTSVSVVLHASRRLLIIPGAAVDSVTVDAATAPGEETTAGDLRLLSSQAEAVLVSGDLATFPTLDSPATVRFRLDGSDLPASQLTPAPTTLDEARSALETAFKAVAPADVPASVEVVGSRLVLRAGAGHQVAVQDVPDEPATATALRLTPAAGGRQSLLSGDLSAFAGLTVNPRIQVEIAGVSHIGRFARVPLGLAAAQAELQAAIRGAGSGASFADAEVEVLENRLLARSGQPIATIRFADVTPGPGMATLLKLTDSLSFYDKTFDGLLSGTGVIFPNLSLNATFGSSTVGVTLDHVPGDLALLAPVLQAALRAAAPAEPDPARPAFTQAAVLQTGSQLLVLAGKPLEKVVFTAPPAAKPDLVALLQLGANAATTIEGLLSGELKDPPELKVAPRFEVTLGSTKAKAVLSQAPTKLGEARTLLEEAIRAAQPSSTTFTRATVEVLGDRLLVTAGTAGDTVVLADPSTGGTAPMSALRLAPGLATAATGVLSGDLRVFPRLSVGPRFQATFNALTLTAYLSDLPADLEGYRGALEAALRAAGAAYNAGRPPKDAETAFSLARVHRIGGHFVVQPGNRNGLPVQLEDPAAPAPSALAPSLVAGTAFDGILSGDLASFTGLSTARPKVDVALGTLGFQTVVLESSPTHLEDLRTYLERALRAAHPADTYRQAAVRTLGDRLLITPGQPADAIVIAPSQGRESDVAGLKLDRASLVPAGAFLTGPVKALSAGAPPRLKVRLGSEEAPWQVIQLARPPVSLQDAATLLQEVLRKVNASATVEVLADRLHIQVSGFTGDKITFTPVETPDPPDSDPLSVFRFRLDAASAEPAEGLLSGDLSAFPQLGGRLVVDVKIGQEGPHPAELPFIPFTPEEARESLEQAVRSAHASPAFSLARVVLAKDNPLALPSEDPGFRLVLLPGRPDPVTVSRHGADPDTAADLRLATDEETPPPRRARKVDALLSGLLPSFVRLTSPTPAAGVRLRSANDELTFDAPFTPAWSSLAAIAAALQEGIRAQDGHAAAKQALVALLGPPDHPERLVILPGEGGFSVLLAAAADDPSSVGELRLEAGSAVGRAGEPAGPAMSLVRSTIFGRLVLRELQASETLFTEPVHVERRHVGCVRYCYLPEGSETPRRFRCQPDLAIARAAGEALELLARQRALASVADLPPADAAQVETLQRARMHAALVPRFTSSLWGRPGYGQLRLDVAGEIAAGAEDGSEIGAFQRLHEPERRRRLALLIDEYLRFGLDAGLFFLT